MKELWRQKQFNCLAPPQLHTNEELAPFTPGQAVWCGNARGVVKLTHVYLHLPQPTPF